MEEVKGLILSEGLLHDLGEIGLATIESNVYSPIPILIIFNFLSATIRDTRIMRRFIVWDKHFSSSEGNNRDSIVPWDHIFSYIIWEFETLMGG